jgi:hypothetical protein
MLNKQSWARFFALCACAFTLLGGTLLRLRTLSRYCICAFVFVLPTPLHLIFHSHISALARSLYRKVRTARTGQPGRDSQDGTARKGQSPEWDSQNGTSRTKQPERDSRNGRATMVQSEQDSQNGAARMGQPERNRRIG